MRILQIIDSLETGGAERMAVSYANALSGLVSFSGIVATRAEGQLVTSLKPDVGYLFLAKTRTIDFRAANRLKKYCCENKIEVLHAHSSSYFIAILVKMLLPRLHVIWHDHNGMSEFLNKRPVAALKLASLFFSGIIVVNSLLKDWAQKFLGNKNVLYLPNFPVTNTSELSDFKLKGTAGKRILCLANLRPQKNHLMLLDIAANIREIYPDWSFHLVGKDFGDSYSQIIKSRIIAENLQENVFLYGSLNNTEKVITDCEIAVITSVSEGLPVSVLECGAAAKAVVVTNVGELSSVVTDGKSGFVVESENSDRFTKALLKLITNQELRNSFGTELQNAVAEKYSAENVISQYLWWLEKIVDEQ